MKKQMKNLARFIPLFLLLALIPVAFAQAASNPCDPGLSRILCIMSDLLSSVLPVLVALGVVYFVWGVVTYVIGDSEEAKKKGRDRIIFGLIGLVVIISLWGLVFIIVDTFELDRGNVAPTNTNLRDLLP